MQKNEHSWNKNEVKYVRIYASFTYFKMFKILWNIKQQYNVIKKDANVLKQRKNMHNAFNVIETF